MNNLLLDNGTLEKVVGLVSLDNTLYRIIETKAINKVHNAVGGIDIKNKKIYISAGIDARTRIKTLLHEFIHDFDYHRLEGQLEERTCNQLASAIYSLLYENSWIAKEIDRIKEEDLKSISSFEVGVNSETDHEEKE